MSLLDRLRVPSGPAPEDPGEALAHKALARIAELERLLAAALDGRDEDAAEIRRLRCRLHDIQAAERHELREARQDRAALTDQLAALRIAAAGGRGAELERARETILDYEDQLATCRWRHGTNSRSHHYPAGAPA